MAKFIVRDSDPGFKKLIKNFKGPNRVDIGVFSEQGSDLVIYAASNEFGTATIPERSYLRAGIDEKKRQIGKLTSKLAEKVIAGKMSKKEALAIIGQTAQSIVQGKMVRGPFTPNRASTVMRKGSSRPLIDTGRLRSSITFKVRK